jgi:alanine racemase
MAKVTIKDIAEKAGVSKTSVSFAFNEPSQLPEATVQRILEAAEELGYVPDPIARILKTGKTGTIGVLVPQPIHEIARNPFFSVFTEGVGEVCTMDGFSLMIVPPLKGSMERAIANATADGFLTLGLEPKKSAMVVLNKRDVPFVMVDSDPEDSVAAVNIEDEKGGYLAMDHILRAGHRKITIISVRSGKEQRYQEYLGTLRRRVKGYLSALKEYDLSIEDEEVHLIECASTLHGGRLAFNEIWKSDQKPTAIVTMSDIIALGVMDAARDNDVSVPDDLSIIGFDDIPYSSLTSPPLSTISQPIRKKGKLAAEMLVEHIEGKIDQSHILLPVSLIERGSVR